MTPARLRAIRARASHNRSLTHATEDGRTCIVWHGEGKWDASYEWDNRANAEFIVAAFTYWDTMVALLEEAYGQEPLSHLLCPPHRR